ncbi:MAG: zinc-ribbon domain-containing protein [Candidatus Heimdallarchaeota archaeon]|nr:zinc-ribbon domain-containing protein [Candidatus Heimdallarchaeota archaeon]MBY8994994.1 zinc-ribbon domain-containing protein [Candidatus Heimdallarchaeota archaeon]
MSDKSSKFCSHCGSIVQPDDVFCNNCGASLDETIEPIGSAPIHQQPYTQTTYPQQAPVYVPQPSNLNNVANAALIIGIISVVVNLIPFVTYIGIVGGIAAIVLGAISFQRTKKKNLAIAGIILGVCGIALWIAGWFGFSLWRFWW